ncbi:DNA helicase B [Trichomycterus rosablanca]|uniref:DNA helicase B n=1 Tax=Trichomycterus rosablanca TaxID=2290929 RepID=UPI002F34F51D
MAPGKTIQLVGYIIPPKDKKQDQHGGITDEESEEEEIENPPEILDMDEMDFVSSGGFTFERSLPAVTEVDFMFRGQKRRVVGRFILSDPWWEISCHAQKSGHKLVVNSYLQAASYSLQTMAKKGQTFVPLFLARCGVDSEFVTQFMQWLPQDRCVDLVNINEALRDFGETSQAVKNAADYASLLISKSDAGFFVRAARMYPNVMKYLPVLLPELFLNLLQRGKEEEEKEEQQKPAVAEESTEAPSPQKRGKRLLLAKLEELIKTDVWKLGFSHIMFIEFRLVRCEAKLKAFKSCDLFSKLSAKHRNALLVYDHLKCYCRKDGHTYIDQKLLDERMKQHMEEISTWDAVELLWKHGVLMVEKRKVALRNLYQAENGIAECLQELMSEDTWKIDLDVREVLLSDERDRIRARDKDSSTGSTSEMDDEPRLDQDQVLAAEMMCANAVTVISGKGGCGKTTVVCSILKAAMNQKENNNDVNSSTQKEGEEKENDEKSPIEVLLTAPTGRAASLLKKRTSFPAYTMHQVYWSYKNASNKDPLKWKFANVRVLVVDEGSLVCVQILNTVLSLLNKYAKLQKFIILGDIRQLPSIAPGNVLYDLFESLKRVNCAIEMHTNHRAESELIVENAGLIAKIGQTKKFCELNFDAVVDPRKPLTMPLSDKSFILVQLSTQEKDDGKYISVKQLQRGPVPGLQDDACSQFVAFRRNDCNLINELCCKHYSDHNTKTHKNKQNFQVGDKICCTRNGYVTDKSKPVDLNNKEQIVKERLCNGEIFFILEDVTVEGKGRSRTLTLDNKQDKVLKADYRELMRECKLQHAWARTIHTFQGSEEKTVVYVLGESRYQNWKHVYTAVTRGQSRVYVIAKDDVLKSTIQRQDTRRNTRLAGLIKDVVRDLGMPGDQCYTPQRGFSFHPSQSTPQSSPSPGPSRANHGMTKQSPKCNTPIRGFGFHPSQSTSKSSPSPGPSRATHSMTKQSPGSYPKDAGGSNNPQSGGSGLFKRENCTDNCPTPPKQPKVETPLLCSQDEPNKITPRQLYPKSNQDSHQDQQP